MREARAAALRLGGIPRMNTYAKLYLALLGQFPWKYLPAIPVELILLPDWFFFNIYEMSSWSRAMLMPLAILNHLKPTRQLPAEKHLHELYPAGLEHTDLSLPRNEKFLSLGNFFISATELFRVFESPGMAWLRDNALEKAKAWMIERMGEGSDGLAAVFPAMLNSIIALRALGHPDDDPLLQKAVRDFEGLFVDDPEDFRIQPCLSPVWDTAINMVALAESGLDPMSDPLQRAANWMYVEGSAPPGGLVEKEPASHRQRLGIRVQ